jgi:hypothetical protein
LVLCWMLSSLPPHLAPPLLLLQVVAESAAAILSVTVTTYPPGWGATGAVVTCHCHWRVVAASASSSLPTPTPAGQQYCHSTAATILLPSLL